MKMIYWICAVLPAAIFLLSMGVLWGAEAARPQDKLMTVHSYKAAEPAQLGCDYLLYLPKDYDAKPGERWPLLLFLHGAGERGANVWMANVHGPGKYILDHPDFPFIVATPQAPENELWSNQTLLGLLRHLSQTCRVDERRVYLTGLSMGGFGSWNLALQRPELFAAVVPVAGGGDDLPIILARTGFATSRKIDALKSLPVWAFHGAKDTVVPPEESKRMIDSMLALGASEAKLTIYPDAEHNSWDKTYSNPEVYAWLLAHHR